jgi:ribosomal protein S18 acetylase RimI-like enzyme
VYVPPEFRQQGHFKSLYKHVREEAQKAGATGLRLYADMGNERAHTAVSSPAA